MPLLLRRPAPPTARQRLVDRALGVSRRRRQLAYVAIGGGMAVLRPMLKRTAAALAVAPFLLYALTRF